jgi:RimJ/RimL family protein N-acetyltransferase
MPFRPTYPIETRRLLLRPLCEGDLEALLDFHSLPAVHRFLPMGPMDAASIMQRITTGPWSRASLEAEGDSIVLGVEVAATGELVGDAMLRWVSDTNRCGEVGYVFNPRHAGHGYATESVTEILRMAFDDFGLHRVIARIDAQNAPSLALAERVGMRREAHFIESWWHNEEWADEIDLAILTSEWGVLRASDHE